MLVISRRTGEKIQIGNDIVITITKTQKGRVKIGIEAPISVPITRGESPVEKEKTPA